MATMTDDEAIMMMLPKKQQQQEQKEPQPQQEQPQEEPQKQQPQPQQQEESGSTKKRGGWWPFAVAEAREQLGITNFVAVKKGSELYDRAKSLESEIKNNMVKYTNKHGKK